MDTAKRIRLAAGALTRRPYWQKIKAIQPANLIGLWRLNEGPASQGYLTLNGSSSYVNCGSTASLDDLHDAELTVEVWFRCPDNTDIKRIVSKGPDGQGWGLSISHDADDAVQFLVLAATTSTSAVSSAGYADGQWHYAAGYFNDAGDRKAYLAIDGVWQSPGDAAVGAVVSDASRNFLIGANSGLGRNFNGDIGWVRISNNDRLNHGVDFVGLVPARTTIPTADAHTVGLWPFNEGYGTKAGDLSANNNDGSIANGDWGSYPAATDRSGQANHGVYTGVQLANAAGPDGVKVPYFDGINDYVNIYSAGLNTDFNGAAGTLAFWLKVANAGVWTDGVNRWGPRFVVDASNFVDFVKRNANNTIDLNYKAGGVGLVYSISSHSPTDWTHYALTWDAATDEFKAYINGSQTGVTKTGLGVWSGNLLNTATVIGSATTNADGDYRGWVGPVAIWTKALTSAEILKLATV